MPDLKEKKGISIKAVIMLLLITALVSVYLTKNLRLELLDHCDFDLYFGGKLA